MGLGRPEPGSPAEQAGPALQLLRGGLVTTPTTQPPPNNGPYNAALAAAYVAAIARLRRSTFGFVERAWNLSGSWREEDARRFVRVVTPVVEAAERSVSALTSSYLDRVASEVTG